MVTLMTRLEELTPLCLTYVKWPQKFLIISSMTVNLVASQTPLGHKYIPLAVKKARRAPVGSVGVSGSFPGDASDQQMLGESELVIVARNK